MGEVKLNLAEALNRVKHRGNYVKEKSESKALRSVVYAEYRLFSELNNRKFSLSAPCELSLDYWAYVASQRLPDMTLENIPKISLLNKVIPAGSLSQAIDQLLEFKNSNYEIYESLSRELWRAHNANHSTDGAKYLVVVGKLRDSFRLGGEI